jgi:hypothetical protein
MGAYSCYKEDCFAQHKAQCWLLSDTTEYQIKCPFYKTIKEYICEEEHKKDEKEMSE